MITAVVLLFSMRGCNGMRDFSPMLDEQVRIDANKKREWVENDINLTDMDLHQINGDRYEGTGTYNDGGSAKVEVEVRSWSWSNTPSNWIYDIQPQ